MDGKFHCDSCQVELTFLARISCLECVGFDLCIECFSKGITLKSHLPTHSFKIVPVLDFPLLCFNWMADEELMFIEALTDYGMGNWDQVSSHVGTKTSKQCMDHYFDVYISSTAWPLPVPVEGGDRRSTLPVKAQVSKPPRPPASNPACHEISGYMPGRLEFETEVENEAEHLIKDLSFSNGDTAIDEGLKLAILEIYNTALDKREERRNFIHNTDVLEYKKNQALERKRTAQEKDIHKKTRVFAKLMTSTDYEEFNAGLNEELVLRQKIHRLQELRRNGIQTHSDAAIYEREEAERRRVNSSLSKFTASSRSQDSDLISAEEAQLASHLKMPPSQYIAVKEKAISMCLHGRVNKKEVRSNAVAITGGINANQFNRLWEFWNDAGWVGGS